LIAGPLLLAFILPLPLWRPAAPRTDLQAWQELLAAFTARGVSVSSDHPRCQERDLDGLYVRGRRSVVVCERNDRALTLRHEGWHLVQSLCLRDGNWLSDEAINRGLNGQDRRELQALVHPSRWRREAEARAMANRPQASYMEDLAMACSERLPVRDASIAEPHSMPQETSPPGTLNPATR
jgi:hypothetical protein